MFRYPTPPSVGEVFPLALAVSIVHNKIISLSLFMSTTSLTWKLIDHGSSPGVESDGTVLNRDNFTYIVKILSYPWKATHGQEFVRSSYNFPTVSSSGRKFLSHRPPIHFSETTNFLDLKMNLPATTLKPSFLIHQCLSSSLEPPNRGKATSLTVKFLRRTHPCFRICKLCGEREARCGEQSEPRQRRENLFIG